MRGKTKAAFRTGIRSALAGTAVLLILASHIVLFFNRLAAGERILARGDTYLYFYPYWRAAAEALSSGRVPLWNPNLFMGVPFMANSQVGFFYPLNWPFWLLLETPYAVSYSIILHLFIASVGFYKLGRRCLSLSKTAAVLGALLFSLGGYVTAQVEHINQIQGIAWLPWYFVIVCPWRASSKTVRESVKLSVSFAVVLTLQILTGHTQTVFISMFAVGFWLILAFFTGRESSADGVSRRQSLVIEFKRGLGFFLPVVAGIVLALLMSAVQLIPTVELSTLSLRQGGLPPNEVLSFSLQPLLIGQSLLPSYDNLVFSEYVVFLPITALLLAAIGARRAWMTRQWRPFLIVAAVGLLLALGRFNPVYHLLAHLPGFSLFRAPARWSVLYAFGIALLSAVGWQALHRKALGQGSATDNRKDIRALIAGAALVAVLIAWTAVAASLAEVVPVAPESGFEAPSSVTLVLWLLELTVAASLILLTLRGRKSRPAALVLLLGTVGLLFISTRIMPYNHPTTPRAYYEQRAPLSFLMATQDCSASAELCYADGGRLLGLSEIFFDLGDQEQLELIYGDFLGNQEWFDYIVASKQKEILGPNLPLAYGLKSVDGFDGGVLPLASYAELMELVLPEGEGIMDGRLREQLDSIPEARWLDQFGAKYIIADKVGDQWRQDIFFDMKHPVDVTAATGPVNVGFLPTFEATDLYLIAVGSPGTAAITSERGEEWLLEPAQVGPDFWRLSLPQSTIARKITLIPCSESGREDRCDANWHVYSLAMANDRDGTFMPLVAGEYRLVYSGDVKIYENLDVLPMADILFNWQYIQDEDEAVNIMAGESFDPESTAVILGAGLAAPGTGEGAVQITSYQPEQIRLRVETNSPALVRLRESFYPGWRATIDGESVAVLKTDSLFRGVFVPEGTHIVELVFSPMSYRAGTILSALGVTVWLILLFYAYLLPVTSHIWRRETPRD